MSSVEFDLVPTYTWGQLGVLGILLAAALVAAWAVFFNMRRRQKPVRRAIHIAAIASPWLFGGAVMSSAAEGSFVGGVGAMAAVTVVMLIERGHERTMAG